MKKMWQHDLSKKSQKLFNTRSIGHNWVTLLPSSKNENVSYACPPNREPNALLAANFWRPILDTHPALDSIEETPEHTIIIEAGIESTTSKKRHIRIDNVLCHKIITTCRDDNIMYGQKKLDPALCLYTGACLMCVVENKYLSEKVPRGNGTLCRLVSVKMRNDAISHSPKK